MTAATLKKVCNICGAETTYVNKGHASWYTDPLYTSLWLCHNCYFKENIQVWANMRRMMHRIKRPRSVLRSSN